MKDELGWSWNILKSADKPTAHLVSSSDKEEWLALEGIVKPGDFVITQGQALNAFATNMVTKFRERNIIVKDKKITQADTLHEAAPDFMEAISRLQTTEEEKQELKALLQKAIKPSSSRSKRMVVFTEMTVEGLGPFKETHCYPLNHLGVCLVTASVNSVRSNGMGKTTLGATALLWCFSNDVDLHISGGKRNISDLIHQHSETALVRVCGHVRVCTEMKEEKYEFSICRSISRSDKKVKRPDITIGDEHGTYDQLTELLFGMKYKKKTFTPSFLGNILRSAIVWTPFEPDPVQKAAVISEITGAHVFDVARDDIKSSLNSAKIILSKQEESHEEKARKVQHAIAARQTASKLFERAKKMLVVPSNSSEQLKGELNLLAK